MWPCPYLFTILESGHILLNYLAAAWSAILKENLCSKQFSFHYFWSKFAVTEMAPKSVNFLCCCAGPTYPLCFVVSLCLSISFSPPCATLKSLPHSIQNKAVTFPGYLIFYNLYSMNRWLHTVLLLLLWRSWFWTLRHLFCNALISFAVPILPGNNRKLGLNENKLRCRLVVRDMEQKFWKSLHFWKFRYRIYISYMPFWKYWVRISKKSGVSARF